MAEPTAPCERSGMMRWYCVLACVWCSVSFAQPMDIPVPDEADLTVPASIIWTGNE